MLTRHCAPIICFADFFSCSVRHSYWRRVRRCAIILADCKEDERVLCASPIFKPIACKLSISNRRRKYVEEKTMATLKFKQSSIATVLNHLLTVARFPIPLIFRYPLPLRGQKSLGPLKMSLEMAHKVILPPKKNYIPQFLKQRDINSYYMRGSGGIGVFCAHRRLTESLYKPAIPYNGKNKYGIKYTYNLTFSLVLVMDFWVI
jgi:hypothetical protein